MSQPLTTHVMKDAYTYLLDTSELCKFGNLLELHVRSLGISFLFEADEPHF